MLDHLSCCSPCFGDYEKLARQNRLARNLKLLALCASLLLCIGVTAWYYSRVPEQQPQDLAAGISACAGHRHRNHGDHTCIFMHLDANAFVGGNRRAISPGLD